MVLLAGVGCLALGYLSWNQWRSTTQIALLPGARLREAEIGRAQLAFGELGLNEFEIHDGQIWVPFARRDLYLKALADRQVLPDISQNIYDSEESIDLWSNRQQQHEMSLLRKKKMIRQMILQLGFVADAYVDLDELTEPGFPPVVHRKVAVVVRPVDQRVMENHQIRAIRETVRGQVAGLDRQDIVITDIAAGFAYVGDESTQPTTLHAGLITLEKARIGQRIMDRLERLGGEAQVDVQFCETATQPVNTPSTPVQPPIGLVVNRPVSLESIKASGDDAAGPPAPHYHVNVQVRIARCLEPAESNSTVDQAVIRLQNQIRDELKPLLVSDSIDCAPGEIDVVIDRPALASNTTLGSDPLNWSRSTSLAILVVSGTLVFLIVHLIWRPDRNDPGPSVSENSRHARGEDTGSMEWNAGQLPLAEETRQKLRQVVDRNPDEAAEIIKQWIREAA